MAVDESNSGRLAVGKLDREPQAEARAGERSFCSPISSKSRAPSPRITGTLDTGYQTTLPKPRRPVKANADLVPVGVQGDVVGRADGEQALRIGRDLAGVGDVELEVAPGASGGERDRRFVQLAGVVGVGVERGHLERQHLRPSRRECAPS